MSHAGDITCTECWALLAGDPRAQLVDVRTAAEWNFVGMPDLSTLGREPILVEWQSYPSMAINPAFVEQLASRLERLGTGPDAPVLFLCRSGARSASAASAMTRAGYSRAHNIAGGFEGARNSQGHRGRVEGWKHDGLPWAQG